MRRLPAIVPLICVAISLAADGPSTRPATAPALTRQQLGNMTYRWPDATGEIATLLDGQFHDLPDAPGSACHLIVDLGPDIFSSDIDGDGLQDAAVILHSSCGGSGMFQHLAIVLNRAGRPVHVATQFLGDRIRLRGLLIHDDIVEVHMLTQGPDDPMCNPTLPVTRRWRLRDGMLVELD